MVVIPSLGRVPEERNFAVPVGVQEDTSLILLGVTAFSKQVVGFPNIVGMMSAMVNPKRLCRKVGFESVHRVRQFPELYFHYWFPFLNGLSIALAYFPINRTT
jgi:hypothetical protein